MLMMKNFCEKCSTPLSLESEEAFICSYECTFCKNCVEKKLNHICPNCGGEFKPRPKRIIN